MLHISAPRLLRGRFITEKLQFYISTGYVETTQKK